MSKKTFALTSLRSTLRATRPTIVTSPITSLPLRHYAPGTWHTSANQGAGELSPLVAYAATHSVEAALVQLDSSPRGHAADLVQTPATPGIRPSAGDAQRLPAPPTCPARPGRCRRAGTPRT